MFLFTDSQIKEESFLEDVNNLLNAGEVPNLFALDEKQEICEKMRQWDRWDDCTYSRSGVPQCQALEPKKQQQQTHRVKEIYEKMRQ